jgi:lysophospholipase
MDLDLLSQPSNPAPQGAVVAKIRTQDGIELRTARWSSGPATRGTVAVLPGFAEFIEIYFEVIGELLGRGYDVVGLDWRGHGLSTRLLVDPFKGHVEDFSDYQKDLQALHEAVLQPFCPQPWYALGHSMGGANLLAQAHDGSPFARMVVVTPLIDFGQLHYGTYSKLGVRLLTRLATMIGLGRHYIPGGGAKPGYAWPFDSELITSDEERYRRGVQAAKARPALKLGDATFGWARAAVRLLRQFETPGYAERIATPTLIVAAGLDRLTSPQAAEAFAKRLPNGRFQMVAGARHELLMERDALRAEFWRAFDDFLPCKQPGTNGA